MTAAPIRCSLRSTHLSFGRETTTGEGWVSFGIERYCLALRCAPRRPVATGSHSGQSFEGVGEVGLVRETRSESDLRERVIRRVESMTRELDAPTPEILSNGLPVGASECAREIDGMDSHKVGNERQ